MPKTTQDPTLECGKFRQQIATLQAERAAVEATPCTTTEAHELIDYLVEHKKVQHLR